jgi:competence protein ComEC
LRGQGVDRLHTIVLTRGDKAHAAGLSAVVEKIRTTRAAHSGTGSRSKFFWNWLELMRQRHLQIATIREGDDWVVERDLHLRVLNPPRESPYTRSDDNAIVLLLEFGQTRLLLTSDIGATVERRLLENHTDVHAQVIIKGRHSEETSCTDEFLDAARPEAVVQCVSPLPSDRYLQPELRDRLRQRGVAYYRTDETGAVTVRLTRTGYSIRTWNPK